ncbi:MAG: c-type cytochrome [Candidatus Sulfotelmatobacter sp.]
MNWRTVRTAAVAKIGLALIFLAAIGTTLAQNGKESTSSPQPELRGKSVFELKCATCHGLDGLGGEHAPDIVRRLAMRTLSDQALLDLIHEGITEAGMPGFANLGKEDDRALVAYMRFLQGKSAGDSSPGDSVRGRNLFFGKANCSACHSRGQFVAEDLTGFARDHEMGEIREMVLRPAGDRPEAVTAVAGDGRKFSGMIRNEDNASLQLQDEDGRFYLLMKSSLMSVQRKTGEPMPLDYGQRLSTSDLDDLVAYILREARAPDVPSSPSGKEKAPHIHD